jgi:hypothetical protein
MFVEVSSMAESGPSGGLAVYRSKTRGHDNINIKAKGKAGK